jgi:DNA-binding NarL/FixJ family response regulator
MTIDCGTIAVVDDDAAFRGLVVELLTLDGHRTAEFGSGEEFLRAAGEEPPALVLLDVQLPGRSGYEVSYALRSRFGDDLPIMFVSGVRTEPHDRAAGLLIGADDYVVKPVAPDELIARVRRLLRRPRHPRSDATHNSFTSLTARESEVLNLLAQGKSQKEISAELFISSNTVATHIQRVLAKLNVHSRAEAVATAYRLNLVGNARGRHVA